MHRSQNGRLDADGGVPRTSVFPGAKLRVGLYDTYLNTMGGGENLGAVFIEFLEDEFENCAVDLLTHEQQCPSVAEISERFNVSLRKTRIVRIPTNERDHLRSIQPLRRFLSEHDLGRVSRSYDLFVNNTIFSLAPSKARCGIYMCMFPLDPVPWQLRDRPFGRRVFRPYVEFRRHLYKHLINSYSVVVAISEFTRTWIRRLWRLESTVLYPPVETREQMSLSDKRKTILSIGRFFPGSHNKKHDVLIDAFKTLREERFGDWELCLVGGRTNVPGTDEYIRELRARAEGHPIRFHIDAPTGLLKDLMKAATLYWHATGVGENQLLDPYKLEHFGIATVEAMSNGCVPIVFACGGQTEIIEHGKSGLLWSHLDELVSLSRNIIRDPGKLHAIATAAHRRALVFSRKAFRARARELMPHILSTLGRPQARRRGTESTVPR